MWYTVKQRRWNKKSFLIMFVLAALSVRLKPCIVARGNETAEQEHQSTT
jgi:hypothetical protein